MVIGASINRDGGARAAIGCWVGGEAEWKAGAEEGGGLIGVLRLA